MRQEQTITVDVAPGELIDKITILEIKAQRIRDTDKLRNINTELELLIAARNRAIEPSAKLSRLAEELRETNERLWDIEDEIRDCERKKEFGPAFIELARAVYRSNDHRAQLKREVNQLLGSQLIEEKSYSKY